MAVRCTVEEEEEGDSRGWWEEAGLGWDWIWDDMFLPSELQSWF